MANVDRPNGFRFGKSLTGQSPNAMIRLFEAGDRTGDTGNNAGDIYIGDPVKLIGGEVFPAHSGDVILGVAVAVGKNGAIEHGEDVYFNADDLSQRYASLTDVTGVTVGVIQAEDCLFEIQTATALDLVQGQDADFSSDAGETHGSQITGNSIAELVTDSNVDVKVVEHVRTPNNDTSLANARHLVKFNTTKFAPQ